MLPIGRNSLLTYYQYNEKIITFKLPFTSLKPLPNLKLYLMIFETTFKVSY